MKNTRIIFLGTPKISATVLQGLIDNNYNIVAVITQPDKIVGRKNILTFSEVKKVAIANNIPIYQPIKIRKEFDFVYDLKPDLLVSCAYGQLIPQAMLDIASITNVNVHGSLLPKYRGGAPIQRAIMAGETETGITIMQMIDKMDAGVIYAKKNCPILNKTNSTELFESLALIGKDLLLETLPSIIAGQNKGEEQNESEVTFAFNIKREEEKLDLNMPLIDLYNKIRGLAINPGGYVLLNEQIFKIYQTSVYDNIQDEIGKLTIVGKKTLLLACNGGHLSLEIVQPFGKKILNIADYLNGCNKEALLKLKMC